MWNTELLWRAVTREKTCAQDSSWSALSAPRELCLLGKGRYTPWPNAPSRVCGAVSRSPSPPQRLSYTRQCHRAPARPQRLSYTGQCHRAPAWPQRLSYTGPAPGSSADQQNLVFTRKFICLCWSRSQITLRLRIKSNYFSFYLQTWVIVSVRIEKH